jgi:hypothetical protein
MLFPRAGVGWSFDFPEAAHRSHAVGGSRAHAFYFGLDRSAEPVGGTPRFPYVMVLVPDQCW